MPPTGRYAARSLAQVLADVLGHPAPPSGGICLLDVSNNALGPEGGEALAAALMARNCSAGPSAAAAADNRAQLLAHGNRLGADLEARLLQLSVRPDLTRARERLPAAGYYGPVSATPGARPASAAAPGAKAVAWRAGGIRPPPSVAPPAALLNAPVARTQQQVAVYGSARPATRGGGSGASPSRPGTAASAAMPAPAGAGQGQEGRGTPLPAPLVVGPPSVTVGGAAEGANIISPLAPYSPSVAGSKAGAAAAASAAGGGSPSGGRPGTSPSRRASAAAYMRSPYDVRVPEVLGAARSAPSGGVRSSSAAGPNSPILVRASAAAAPACDAASSSKGEHTPAPALLAAPQPSPSPPASPAARTPPRINESAAAVKDKEKEKAPAPKPVTGASEHLAQRTKAQSPAWQTRMQVRCEEP